MQIAQDHGEEKGDRHYRQEHELKNRQPKISPNSHGLLCCTAQGRSFASREFAYAQILKYDANHAALGCHESAEKMIGSQDLFF
jgi:hypothetical protein